MRHSRTHDGEYNRVINSYICHEGECMRTSARWNLDVLHTRRHNNKQNGDQYPDEVKAAMISSNDPGVIMVHHNKRRLCFDSVYLPSNVKGENGKMQKFFSGRERVLHVESVEEDMNGEVRYRLSIRKHVPIYDLDGKLVNDDSWNVSAPLFF